MVLGGQLPQQRAAFHQLSDDEGDLQQLVIRLPFLRVGAVNVLQIRAMVFLAIERLILDFSARASSFLGDESGIGLGDELVGDPGEVWHFATR